MKICPLSAGYATGMENFYTTDENSLSIGRKILIKESANESYFKMGNQDPYIEFYLRDLQVGDVITVEMDVMSTNGSFNVFTENQGNFNNIYSTQNETQHHILNIPVKSNAKTCYFNIRGMNLNSIVKNIEVTNFKKEDYFETIILKKDYDFKRNIFDSINNFGIYPSSSTNYKYLNTSELFFKGLILVNNNKLSWNVPNTYKYDTFGFGFNTPTGSDEILMVIKVNYTSNIDWKLTFWDSKLYDLMTVNMPQGTNTRYVIRRIDCLNKNTWINSQAYNFSVDVWNMEINSIEIGFSYIGKGNPKNVESYGKEKLLSSLKLLEKREILWSGAISSVGETSTLIESFKNFKEIMFVTDTIGFKETFTYFTNLETFVARSGNRRMNLRATSETSIRIEHTTGGEIAYDKVTEIIGIGRVTT